MDRYLSPSQKDIHIEANWDENENHYLLPNYSEIYPPGVSIETQWAEFYFRGMTPQRCCTVTMLLVFLPFAGLEPGHRSCQGRCRRDACKLWAGIFPDEVLHGSHE
jgi:hypothetical protein